jgi:hypothetical protein
MITENQKTKEDRYIKVGKISSEQTAFNQGV